MTTALVVIDIQNDFCFGGSLAVPDADAVIPAVNDLMREFRLVVFTQDRPLTVQRMGSTSSRVVGQEVI